MNEQQTGMLAAFVAYTIFGLSFLFSKVALGVASPMVLLCVRFGVTVIALNLLVLFRLVWLELKGKKLGAAILLGVLQPVLYFVFENYGIKFTTTSFAGMMSASGIAALMFEALYSSGININMISTSEIKVSVLVDINEADRAVQAIHDRFFAEFGDAK